MFECHTQKDKKKDDKKDKKEKKKEKEKGGNYLEDAIFDKKDNDINDDPDGQDSVDTEVGVDDIGAMGKVSWYLQRSTIVLKIILTHNT